MQQQDLWGQRSFPTSFQVLYTPNFVYPDEGGIFTASMGWSKGDQNRGRVSLSIDEFNDDIVYALLEAAWHGYTRTNAEWAMPHEVQQAKKEWKEYFPESARF